MIIIHCPFGEQINLMILYHASVLLCYNLIIWLYLFWGWGWKGLGDVVCNNYSGTCNRFGGLYMGLYLSSFFLDMDLCFMVGPRCRPSCTKSHPLSISRSSARGMGAQPQNDADHDWLTDSPTWAVDHLGPTQTTSNIVRTVRLVTKAMVVACSFYW